MRSGKGDLDVTTCLVASLSLMGTAALFVAGKGQVLRVAIPAAACFVALSLYLRRPAAYLQFVLWCWFVTPLARRVVDWRVGFADPNLVLLTPFLVSWIAILTLRERKTSFGSDMTPFVLCGAGIAYGFCVGLAIHPSGEVIYGLVNWLSPMLLGIHIYLRRDHRDANLAAIQRAALWGVLIMGAYGIWQFFKPPIWDKAWLENLPGGLESSTFGQPQPEMIRVWSTSNAPGPFSNVIVALLFLIAPIRSKLKIPAIALAIYALLLSLVRAAWLTGFFGVLYLALVVGGIALVLLVNSSLSVPIVQQRLKTLGDLKSDESVHDRATLYEGLPSQLLNLPAGIGLNNMDFYHGYPLDSGLIRMLLNLGWFGTLAYSLGILRLLVLIRKRGAKSDVVVAACNATVIAFMIQMIAGITVVGTTGAMFWIAAGIGLASPERSLVRAPHQDGRVRGALQRRPSFSAESAALHLSTQPLSSPEASS